MTTDIVIRSCCGGPIGFGHINRTCIITEYLYKAGYRIDVLINTYGRGCEKYINTLEKYSNIKLLGSRYVYLKDLYGDIPKIVIYDISNSILVEKDLISVKEEIEFLKKLKKISIVYDGIERRDSIHRNITTTADYIIIPYPVESKIFNITPENRILCGLEYFICSQHLIDLLKRKIKKENLILIFLSGKEDSRENHRLYRILEEEGIFERFDGFEFIFISTTRFNTGQHKNLKLYNVLSYKEFLNLLSKSSLLITSTGLTKYEAIFLNVPVVIYLQTRKIDAFHRQLESNFRIKCVSETNKDEIGKIISELLSENDPNKKIKACSGVNNLMRIITSVKLEK